MRQKTRRQKQRLEWCSYRPRSTRDDQQLLDVGDLPPRPLEGVQTCQHHAFGLWPPELWENKLPLFSAAKFLVITYSSLTKIFLSYQQQCSGTSPSLILNFIASRWHRKDSNPDLLPPSTEHYSFYCSVFSRECLFK